MDPSSGKDSYAISLHISHSLLFHSESYAPLGRRLRRSHELSYGLEDDSELFVVFLLKLFQFTCQVFVSGKYLPKPDEGPHDLDVHEDGPFATQHR